MLPQPNDAFAWAQAHGGPVLVCRPLEAVVSHFFTTREWRLGSGPAEGSDDAWADVAAAAEVTVANLVRLRQVHGASVVVRRAGMRDSRETSPPLGRPEGDIMLSDDGSAALAIQTADCVPLLIADRRLGVAAAAHAGWRGLA